MLVLIKEIGLEANASRLILHVSAVLKISVIGVNSS